jgi:polyisoprenyl-phosphate glycosyltransferase
MISMPKYSVVVPVYNGENSLQDLLEQIIEFFSSRNESFETIFIDDASSDGSWDTLKQLKNRYPDFVKLIQLAKNAGQHNATLCGILNARGEFSITIDDDLQEPREIEKLILKQNESGADLVYGVYENKNHSLLRNIGSRVINIFFRLFSNTYGNGSSFRLIRNSITKNFTAVYQKYLLLDQIISWHTDNITHTYVIHHPRKAGTSGYSVFKLALLTINYIINYTVIPLRLMTYGGLLFSIISLLLGSFYLYKKIFHFVELGYTSIIVAIFFSSSLILFCLGIIGEYITRIYSKETSRPIFVIKERIE